MDAHSAAARGATCLNCATPLAGPWCYRCGQRVEAHHRPLRHMLFEMVELLTHADSRLWRTLGGLAFRPARLTTEYLEGKRAGQIPPLRLFFVMLLLFFGSGSFFSHVHLQSLPLDPAALARSLQAAHLSGRPAAWAQIHIERAAADPKRFLEVVGAWTERLAFLMLPISTILLSLIFVTDRSRTVYDHVIFSLHSLSFCLMVLTVLLLPWLDAVGGFLLLMLPVHLFMHMRGTYGTRTAGTLLRMTVLAVGCSIGVAVLAGMLAMLGLQFVDA